MNRVLLSGRVVADPELRYTPAGKAVASYRLAVERPFKSEGEQKTDFLSCVAWGKIGEFGSTSPTFTEIDYDGDLPF